MLPVTEAQKIILQQARPLAPQPLSLGPAVLNHVLAEDVASDLDSPPFDKALMDGYAVRSVDLPTGSATLDVIEEVTAGRTPQREVGPGQATRIMTGAPMPAGADAVIPIERTKPAGTDRVTIDDRPPKPGTNLLHRGREMRRGEVVLAAGSVLRPQELGVLAAVGRTSARIIPAPRVAVMTTGDEVVEAPQLPGPGQIRNGNSPMIVAQVARAGGVPTYLGIARDTLDELRPMIAKGLTHDVLVLSGGVSAGKLDLVPGALADAGMTAHFHKIAMKPGKPLLFGTVGATLVFGLPGNPVSSFVCFELFVRPALAKLRGLADPRPRFVNMPLAESFPFRSDRPTYHPATIEPAATGWQARRVPWFGSPDLLGVTKANALMLLEAGEREYSSGDAVAVLPLA